MNVRDAAFQLVNRALKKIEKTLYKRGWRYRQSTLEELIFFPNGKKVEFSLYFFSDSVALIGPGPNESSFDYNDPKFVNQITTRVLELCPEGG